MLKLMLVNILTAARPLAVVALFLDIYQDQDQCYTRQTLVWLFIGLTDVIDGWLARKWKVETKFGAAFDSATDKFVALLMSVALLLYRSFPVWVYWYALAILAIWAWQYYAYTNEVGVPPRPRRLGRMGIVAAFIAVVPFLIGQPKIGEYLFAIPIAINILAFFDYKRAYGFRWSLFHDRSVSQ